MGVEIFGIAVLTECGKIPPPTRVSLRLEKAGPDTAYVGL